MRLWISFISSCEVDWCFDNFRFCTFLNNTLNHISLNSGCSTFSYITSLTINIVSCSRYNLTFWTLTDFFFISKIFSWVFDIESCNRIFFFHNLVTSRYPHNSISRVYRHWWLFIWSSNTSSLIHRISCNSRLTSSSTLFCHRFFIFWTSRIFNKTFRWRQSFNHFCWFSADFNDSIHWVFNRGCWRIFSDNTCFRVNWISRCDCSCTLFTNNFICLRISLRLWISFISSCKINWCFNNIRTSPNLNNSIDSFFCDRSWFIRSYHTSSIVIWISCSFYNFTNLTCNLINSTIFFSLWVWFIECIEVNRCFLYSRFNTNTNHSLNHRYCLNIWRICRSCTVRFIHRVSRCRNNPSFWTFFFYNLLTIS